MISEGWIEFEDTGIPEVGLVARPKVRVVIEGAEGKSRERILDILSNVLGTLSRS